MFLPFIHRNMFAKKNPAVLIGLVLSAIFVLVSLSNVLQATETSGAYDQKTTKTAFGVTTLLATLFSGKNLFYDASNEVVNNWQTIIISSYILFVIATIIWVAVLISAQTRGELAHNNLASEREQLPWILTLGSGGVLLFPYLLGNNHDYRLIFLIPLAAGAALLSARRAVVGPLLAVCAGITAITSAPMIPTSNGLNWPAPALVAGDTSLLILLSGVVALWLTTAFTTPKSEMT
jgi:cytochrome bd-type quinol oxidase subunit 2